MKQISKLENRSPCVVNSHTRFSIQIWYVYLNVFVKSVYKILLWNSHSSNIRIRLYIFSTFPLKLSPHFFSSSLTNWSMSCWKNSHLRIEMVINNQKIFHSKQQKEMWNRDYSMAKQSFVSFSALWTLSTTLALFFPFRFPFIFFIDLSRNNSMLWWMLCIAEKGRNGLVICFVGGTDNMLAFGRHWFHVWTFVKRLM